jgi:uncharacterized protein with ParB-like and HNH nuclease domain
MAGGRSVPASSRRQNFQTISWFYDIYRRKLLNLAPPYQRRSVWNQAYKDEFVDTVLLQYPAPAIFLYEEVSAEGVSIYQVVDGKQRLTSVFDFSTGIFPVSEDSPLTHLRGKYFENLSRDEKTAFWTYQFPIEYLPTNDETIINTIFQRINKNTARLTRQELRHARFGGQFITAAEELSENVFKTLPEGFPRIESQSRKQMKDVELVANLLLFLEEGVRGYSQDELDEAFSDRETEWEQASDIRTRFVETAACIASIAVKPTDNPLHKTRLRNQADFYSLFTAIADSLMRGQFNCASDDHVTRLTDFIASVEDDQRRAESRAATDYFKAARSNSNDTGPRKKRHEIMLRVLEDSLNDYTDTDTEQIQFG